MSRDEPSIMRLPEHRVEVVEPGRSARRNWVKCEIDENLKFDTAGLDAYGLASWDPRVFDAFALAAAVQFCDHTKARPATGWGRDIALHMPVHDSDHWNSAAVSGALHNALAFLTGDRWEISFVARNSVVEPPCQGRLHLPDGARVIMPYSDGLDSRAVAGLMARDHGNKLIRVRLGSRSFNKHRRSAQRLPFAVVPYHVHFGDRTSVETSARSRGFRFALLSGIAAYLSEARKVIVTESGQGALGPTLIPVGHAYEDFRNHPLFTDRMETFLSGLFEHEVHYSYPRIWNTKGETLGEFIAECPDGANWAQTRSCWQGSRQVSVSGRMRQCGVCAACMLRRMSVHAVGRTESREAYVWENLKSARYEGGAAPAFRRRQPKGAMYEYAIAGTLHLDHLAGLRHSAANRAVIDRKAFQLSRSLRIPEQIVRKKLDRLLTQHQKEWHSFLGSLGRNSFVAKWALGAA